MKYFIPHLILIALLFIMGCSSIMIGKNCNYAFRDVNGELEKTELAVCEKP